MSIITEAVREGCKTMPGDYDESAIKPGTVIYRALETAARHAAEAVKASALFIATAGQENPQFIPQDIAAIPTEEPKT